MSGAKWQNIAGSKNFFSHNFKEQKNGLVNLSFMPFSAIFTQIEIKENNLQLIDMQNRSGKLRKSYELSVVICQIVLHSTK